MDILDMEKELKSNPYHGRGIVIGKSADGKSAVTAYFIMGRSVNSRNRVFLEDGEGIKTQAFDPSKMVDPHLIIYSPVRVLGNKTIVTNGDQTDTIYDGMDKQMTFEQSLRCREFEDDSPNFTPRISGVIHLENGGFNYAMSILKSADGNPDSCSRFTFSYTNPLAGQGHFIHTYKADKSTQILNLANALKAGFSSEASGIVGEIAKAVNDSAVSDAEKKLSDYAASAAKEAKTLLSYEGEPKLVSIPDDIDEFTNTLWSGLNEDNKVSLFVRYIDLATGEYKSRIVNKNV